MWTTKILEDGQIILPEQVLMALQLEEGSELEVWVDGDCVRLSQRSGRVRKEFLRALDVCMTEDAAILREMAGR